MTTRDSTQPAAYVELHCHSCFSFREGASTPLELILTARELGYDALALTDHDALAGAMIFAQEARDWGLKAIIGAEVTLLGSERREVGRAGTAVARPSHITLLAETPRGYANISRLISHAHLNSPRDDVALDPAQLSACVEGIIALSGCREGEIARLAAADELDAACEIAELHADMYGRKSFFIELQDNFVHGDGARNRNLVEVARRTGLGVVATNNVHYHDQARHRLQDVMVAVQHRSTLDASERLRRPNAEFYLKPPAEMERLFRDMPEAIMNTRRIADRCHFDLTRDLTYKFPDFNPADVASEDAPRC